MRFSSKNRKKIIEELQNEYYDLLIIGGGITGSGIALDAVTRGMKVALIEMNDFASGTSSRSTKLVHGGLRYLKQFEFKTVATIGKERAIVYENGPHVTTPEWMLLPFYEGGTFGKFMTTVGLTIYDFLAQVKKTERKTMLSPEQTLEKEPLLKKDGLKGGGYYVEYRTDDARLTIEVLKAAVSYGALAINYVKAEELIYQDKTVSGVRAKNQLTDDTFEIKAKVVVNAAGPWVDYVRKKDYSINDKQLRLSKGVHIVFDQSVFPLRQSIYFDTPDGRMIFAIPREGKTYVGTTDTFFDENLEETSPKPELADIDYLIQAVNYMFPTVKVTRKDVESSWAGVRPLIYEEGKSEGEISRKDEIWIGESGLITIAGGKLTGYREMAEKVVNLISEKLSARENRSFPACQTRQIKISGSDIGGASNFPQFIERKAMEAKEFGIDYEEGRFLAQKYGSNVDRLFEYSLSYPGEEEACSLPPSIYAQLMYSIEEEMTVTPVDFFARRTGTILFNIGWVKQWKDAVVEFMAKELGWDSEMQAHYQENLENEIRDAQIAFQEIEEK